MSGRIGTWSAAGVVAAVMVAAGVAGEPAWAAERVTAVVQAYQKAHPAVVNISTQSVVRTGIGIFGDAEMDEIFPSPFTRQVPVQSLGSGVIIDPAGYIVTNAHVVARAQKITVTLSDAQAFSARVISADEAHDLAVLKVEADHVGPLPYLPLGRSDDLMVGETVIAIGNPLGLSNTVTTGVVSATGRVLEFSRGVRYTGLIQIDAPVNPGNSGGPLLNINGELVGINTAIRADAQNIGFAIPVGTLADQMARLMDFERINRVIFGAQVSAGPLAEPIVQAVAPGSPADGVLLAGDVVEAVDPSPTPQVSGYACAMLAAKADQPIRLTVRRGQQKLEVTVTPRAKPRPDGQVLAQRLLGMTLIDLTPELADRIGLGGQHGLLLAEVEHGGPAYQAGLKPGDLVFQVEQYYLKDLDGLGTVLEDVQPGQPVRVGVARGNLRAWMTLATWNGQPSSARGI